MKRAIIRTDRAPAAIGPYSQGVVSGGKALVFTAGQILYQTTPVLAPVSRVRTAISSSITAQASKTVFVASLRMVTRSGKAPRKISVRPSAMDSMAMIFRLSVVISPKPLTMFRVGIRWAIPQRITTAEPM